jgi:hypothetical protein
MIYVKKNFTCGVIVSMLTFTVVNHGFNLWSVKQNIITLAYAASPLNMLHINKSYSYYPLSNEVAKGYSNATVRPSVISL